MKYVLQARQVVKKDRKMFAFMQHRGNRSRSWGVYSPLVRRSMTITIFDAAMPGHLALMLYYVMPFSFGIDKTTMTKVDYTIWRMRPGIALFYCSFH